jgi:hypothetical protein
MAQTVKLKRSNVADSVPTTSDLALGELAMNTRDGKIYMRKTNSGGSDTIIDPIDAAAASDHSHTGATADDVIAMAIALG